MEKLVLYSTVGCHLCEQAKALLIPLLGPEDCVEEVDIADSDQLLERYGVRIPVLRNNENGNEIGWPFDGDQLQTFLATSAYLDSEGATKV